MENSKELMVESVNKIIAQRLIAFDAVTLPGVGTIVIKQKSAEVSRGGKQITAPSRRLDFSSDENLGVSAVSLIMQSAECSANQAEELYKNYIAEVKKGDIVDIAAVATIKGKSVKIYPEFDKQLNPQCEKAALLPVKEKRSGNLFLIALLSAIVAGVLVFALYNFVTTDREIEVVEVVEPEPMPEPKVEPKPAPVPVVKETMYGVVYGVYSTPENVARAIGEVEKLYDGKFKPTTHPYYAKTAVVLFESASRKEAQRFLNNNYDVMENSWIYEIK